MTHRRLIGNKPAADYLGLQPQTLANWRYKGDRGPRYYRVGQLVKYDVADLEKWLEEQASDHQSQPA